MGSTTSTTSPGTPFGDWAPTSISTSALALLGVMVTLVLGFSLTVLLPVVLPPLSSPDVFLSAPVPAWAAASAAGAACTVSGVMVSVCPGCFRCRSGLLDLCGRGAFLCRGSLPSRLCFLGLCYRSCSQQRLPGERPKSSGPWLQLPASVLFSRCYSSYHFSS